MHDICDVYRSLLVKLIQWLAYGGELFNKVAVLENRCSHELYAVLFDFVNLALVQLILVN